MAKFITLTREYSNQTTAKILLNLDQVLFIEPADNGKGSLIYFEPKERIFVIENSESIKSLIGEGSNTIMI